MWLVLKKSVLLYAVLRFMDCYYKDSPLFVRHPDGFLMGQKSKIPEMVISTGLLSEERLWLTVKHKSPVIDDRDV